MIAGDGRLLSVILESILFSGIKRFKRKRSKVFVTNNSKRQSQVCWILELKNLFDALHKFAGLIDLEFHSRGLK